jgi:two-component system, NarL family, sensor kinase
MPNSNSEEVVIVLIACMVLFLILAAIILLFLIFYQRRRFQQRQQLTDLQQQFKLQSLKAQLEIQEQTFLAISQEIHDNVGQVLSLAKVQVNIMTESDKTERSMLLEIRDNIGKAMADLRDLARSLSSDRIQSCGLRETIAQEVDRINKTGIIRTELAIQGEIRDVDPRKKLILFRIIQESIHNCIKHAEATTISIHLHYRKEDVHVSIMDDGKGFDPAALLQGGSGMGLGNIRTRVQLTGGISTIESAIGKGTTITLKIPYE